MTMPASLEVRLQIEQDHTSEWDSMGDGSLEAKLENWHKKIEDNEISPEDALYGPAIKFLDRVGFEVHCRQGKNPAEYVSFHSLYLDNETASV